MTKKDLKVVFGTIIFMACLSSGMSAVAQTAVGTSLQRVTRGPLLIEGIPDIPVDLQDRLQQYQNSRSASLADWLPSGEGMLVTTRFAETSQIHRVDRPGGVRSQLTFFDEPVRGASVSPAASVNGFLYLIKHPAH